ncbi:probable calcium-binding protein CML17 [Aegilops tauschii subsp. strangulata]|nr:probable calcium-binding protein CML11 [Aegilops tauschii subsp. strangulata]
MSEAPATTAAAGDDPDATATANHQQQQQQQQQQAQAQAQPETQDDADQLSELRQIFRSFDRNKDGSLTQLELGSLLRSLGLKPSTDELDALIHRADTNSNGLVEFSEFVALVSPELLDDRSPYSEDQLRRLFEIFDRDGNGFITAAELAHSMAKLGHALTAKELTGMIEEADTDGDGRINFREFSRAITAAAFDNVFS